MPILYSAVARQRTIVSSFACCEGNFTEIVNKILEKVLLYDEKKTYYHGRYLFHYIVEDKIFYLCITDKTCQRSRAFLFLNRIKRKYQYTSTTDLRKTLADEMCRYSEDYTDITIRKGELDELNTISVDSSEKILGEKILKVQYNPEQTIEQPTLCYVNTTPHVPDVFVPDLSDKQRSSKFILVIICVLGVLICMYCSLFTVRVPVFVILFFSFLRSIIH